MNYLKKLKNFFMQGFDNAFATELVETSDNCKIISNRNKCSVEISGAKYDCNGIDSIVNLKKTLS